MKEDKIKFNFIDILYNCFIAIFSHKLRSFLTLLGIMIGVFSLIIMFATVSGINKFIEKELSSLGWDNSLIVFSGSGNNMMNYNFNRRRKKTTKRTLRPLTIDDYYYLYNNVEVKEHYAISSDTWSRLFYKNNRRWINIKGVTNGYFSSKSYSLKEGRYFNNFDIKFGENICIVGDDFIKEFLKDRKDVINSFINVDNRRYKIVGIVKKVKISFLNINNYQLEMDLGRTVFLPLTTGSREHGQSNKVQILYFQSKRKEDFSALKDKIVQLLLARHNMSHDFSFKDTGEEMASVKKSFDKIIVKWNIALISISTITLIVGAIGLFSTLIISINERMVEIGVRKSVGATELNIFVSFIIESAILALIASTIAVLIALFLILIISLSLKFYFPVPVDAIIFGTSFALLIGIISGIYPALKASRIDPIKAIFYN